MNKHPDDQIKRLAKLIEFQGQRHPIVISKRSGFIVAGHGRWEALKLLYKEKAWDKCAVDYQDFDSEAQEYAFMTSDNAIQEWADLDLSMVNSEMLDFGPDFDIDLLGIKDFVVESDEKDEEKEVDLTFDYKLEIDCEEEDKQQMLLMELQDRGFKVRVLL